MASHDDLFEKVFSTIHFLIAHLDRDFNFIRVNPAYADADEKPVDYFPGKNHFDLYPNEENQRIFQSVIDSGESFTAFAKPFVYADQPEKGVTYWDWTIEPIRGSDGRVEELLLILIDVTHSKRTELDLKAARDRLGSLVENQTVGLVKKTEQLNDRIRELDCLHEIRSIYLNPDLGIQEIAKETTGILRGGFRHSDDACARIRFSDGASIQAEGFLETPWRMTSPFTTDGKPAGTLEVCYKREFPPADEGPFTAGERALLDAAANHFGAAVEKRLTERDLAAQLNLNFAISEIYRPIVSDEATIEEICEAVLVQARILTGSEKGFVSLIEAGSNANVLHAFPEELKKCEFYDPVRGRTAIPWQTPEGYPEQCRQALNERRALFINALGRHPHLPWISRIFGPVERFLSAPILLDGELAGQIALWNKKSDYTDADLDATVKLGESYALGIRSMRRQKDLKDREYRFRALFENIQDVVLIFGAGDDPAWRIVEANETAFKRLGLPRSVLIGKPVRDVCLVDDEKFARTMAEIQSVGEKRFECDFRLGDGGTMPVEIHAAPFELDGRPTLLCISRDITERRAAETELKRAHDELETRVAERTADLTLANRRLEEEVRRRMHQQDRNRNILESMADGFLSIDRNGTILECNAAFSRMSGRDPSNLHGLHISEIFLVRSKDEANSRIQSVVERGSRRFDASVIGKSGREVECDVAAHYLPGEEGRIFLFCRDITARKEAEAVNRWLAAVLKQSSDSIMITDTAGVILYVNPAFETLTGHRADDVMGKTPNILKSGKHEDGFYKTMWSTLLKGEVWNDRLVNRKKSGDLFDSETVISPLRDGFGRIVNYIETMRDVTRQVELESQLRQSQKMEALGILAGGIAHDFNNILTATLGYSEFMTAFDDLTTDEMRRYADEIHRSAERASEMVSQILTFSRKNVSDKRPALFTPLIKEALRLIRASLPATIQLDTRIGIESGQIQADPTQIHQILMNLCTNAAHAIGERGGKIVVELEKEDRGGNEGEEFFDLPSGRYFRLTVKDNGCGMEQDTIGRIFDPFFTTKDPGKGTGLGLAVTHGIVKNHGGAITVQSQPGQGSAFNIYLPESRESEEKETIETDAAVMHRGSARILFVDDEEAIAAFGRQMLEKLGHQVTAVTRGMEAIRTFRTAPDDFDLVITDLTMPEITGMEVARRVLALRPSIPVIMISGYADEETARRAKQIGVREFVHKPIRMSRMSNLIALLTEGVPDKTGRPPAQDAMHPTM